MRLNLMMGIFWLCAAVTLLAAVLLERPIANMSPDRATFIGVFGLVLALYNFMRWWAARAKGRARQTEAAAPPRKRYVEKPPAEYHPEFDFGRSDPPPK